MPATDQKIAGAVMVSAADLDLLARSLPRGAMPFAPLAHFEGAGTGRRMAGWRAPATGPNKTVSPAQAILRNRARDAARNVPLAAAIVRTWTSALVGSGIVCRTNTDDRPLRDKIESAWRAWLPEADAGGAIGDFYGLQAQAARSFIESGECFLRMRTRRLDDGLSVPLQVELLESEMVPQFDRDLENGNKIRQGVEFNRIGRRVAYWFHKAHPGDGETAASDLSNLVRVPAEFVSHIFEPERPGQVRGVSKLAPILARLRILDDFIDATSERARLANLFALFIRRPMPSGDGDKIDPLTGKTIETNAAGQPIAALEPGLSQELLPGEEVQFSDPPQPGADFSEFVRAQIGQIAAGVGGIPAELLSGDMRDVTDRALRVALNEWRRVVEAVQWQVIVPKACQSVRAAWAQAAMLAGVLSADEARTATLYAEWTPPRWKAIHPVQDIQGLRLEVEAGFRSRASVVAEMGYDVADVDEERAADERREGELGLQSDAEKLAAAEAEKLHAEAEAERQRAEREAREAEAAKAAATEARANAAKTKAEKQTTDAIREHAVAEARDKAKAAAHGVKVAALEVEAAQVGLAELKNPPGSLALVQGGKK